MEQSVVRENLMTREGYSPYCGNNISRDKKGGCNNPRTNWNGEQFVCPQCGWTSNFPPDFITRYKQRWQNNLLNKKSFCDVCGSDDVIHAPHMGKNCNNCHKI